MSEMNFFSPYINKKQSSVDMKQVIVFLLIILLIALPAFYHFRLLNQKRALLNDINNISNEINVVSDQETMKAIEAAEAKNEAIEVALVTIDEAIEEINGIHNIFVISLKEILENTPTNTYISSIDFKKEYIDIDCISSSYLSAAQYVHNLKNVISEEDKIFMPKISEVDGEYEYSINIELGGELDENE